MMLSNSFASSGFCIIDMKLSMLCTSISETTVQYRSAATSVMMRILGSPRFSLSLDMALNFSTSARTFPGLQYMMSRMSNMLPPVWSVDPLVADNASIVVFFATHQQVGVAAGLSRVDWVLRAA